MDNIRVHPLRNWLIEPISKGPTAFWEGHHATNPCAVRFQNDSRVFLGYRAGGVEDSFILNKTTAWNSHLGLAILDRTGTKLLKRLPLPIMNLDIDYSLPKTSGEYEKFIRGPRRDEINVLHDFRFWLDNDFLYVIYHAGSVREVFDCISRMPASVFLEKVECSLKLSKQPVSKIREEWKAIWWSKSSWEPAGCNGTAKIYSSKVNKNDIVFIRLTDGSLRMLHRPLTDIAILDTKGQTYAPATKDGISCFGSLQTCIRPGLKDNSHIGNNGTPLKARIGMKNVFIDITHGVFNRNIAQGKSCGWKLTYLPYLRILDADTGQCLYYSVDPLFSDKDMGWESYSRRGKWVRSLPHLESCIFSGGQIEKKSGQNGFDDRFVVYFGVGDTSVSAVEFVLKDIVPVKVLRDIHDARRAVIFNSPDIFRGEIRLPGKISGWEWSIRNSRSCGNIEIVRRLRKKGVLEENAAQISVRPGYFDAHGVFIKKDSCRYVEGVGWILLYYGVRYEDDTNTSNVACGLIVMDKENPERILHRLLDPIPWTEFSCQGRKIILNHVVPEKLFEEIDKFIPARVRREILYHYKTPPMELHMTRWLKEKAGIT